MFVVDSRPGGGGAIAAVAVKQALPDGHTLFQANASTHAANVALYPTLAYDPVKDFRPITLMWKFPQLLAVPFDSPAKSVSELVALAKSKPAGLSFASQGTGSGGHLLGEMLRRRTGATMVHEPYRGAGPAAVDLAAGRVDFFVILRLDPVVSSSWQGARARSHFPETSAGKPDVPTLSEIGFDGIALDAWFGLVAPAATPDMVIDRLHAAFSQAMGDPEIGQTMTAQGAEAASATRQLSSLLHRLGSQAIRRGGARDRGQGRMSLSRADNSPV